MSKPLHILITAGSTREPIDPVRFIGNRSSGKMGAALVAAACEAGHAVTLIAGPLNAEIRGVRRIDVDTAAEMHAAVMSEFPAHDVLIMAAAVADFRPIDVSTEKLSRTTSITIKCEPTVDIVAAACEKKMSGQKVVAFSLESEHNLERARAKMLRKKVDLIVFNTLSTMGSDHIRATLLAPELPDVPLPDLPKSELAQRLMDRVALLARKSDPETRLPDQHKTTD